MLSPSSASKSFWGAVVRRQMIATYANGYRVVLTPLVLKGLQAVFSSRHQDQVIPVARSSARAGSSNEASLVSPMGHTNTASGGGLD